MRHHERRSRRQSLQRTEVLWWIGAGRGVPLHVPTNRPLAMAPIARRLPPAALVTLRSSAKRVPQTGTSPSHTGTGARLG